jgi:hypothetical protein
VGSVFGPIRFLLPVCRLDFYTYWTYILYMPIFSRIFLSNYWWQKSDIWSQASYRYLISWEAFFDPSDSYFLFAEERGYHRWALAHSSSCYAMWYCIFYCVFTTYSTVYLVHILLCIYYIFYCVFTTYSTVYLLHILLCIFMSYYTTYCILFICYIIFFKAFGQVEVHKIRSLSYNSTESELDLPSDGSSKDNNE